MKKLCLVIALFLCACGESEKPLDEPVTGEVSIIPHPRFVKRIGGQFEITPQTLIVADDEAGLRCAALINAFLAETHGGLSLGISGVAGESNSIILRTISPNEHQGSSDESYELKVTPRRIEISGTEHGLCNGVQSLLQMMPDEAGNGIRIPAAEISDAPRFRYRGAHLDVARHFMPVAFVKKYIRLAARYKLNYFHWHLTDDQGWRIEIRKYPRLTEIGSKRRETVRGKSYQPYVGDGKPVEGFYTQEDIRDVAAYARANNVTIVPEIDMPGHAAAALAAHPEFGCRQKYPYTVKTTWGGFPDVFCPSDQTLAFLEDVLAEVIDLFPDSPYIHIGGDEVDLTHWKTSPVVRTINEREGLKDENETLRWFVERIGSYVESRGRKIICWDDMIKNGQMPRAVIMSWNGIDIGSRAARSGREVIMMPDEITYFDRPQASPELEPLSLGKKTSLSDVYAFDPIPKDARPEDVKNIIGAQACVWTEFIKTPEHVEYMVFPRLAALAERLWSPAGAKDFVNFRMRLANEFARLDRYDVNYRIPEPYGLSDRVLANGEKFVVDLSSPIPGGKIYYTQDGTEPNTNSTPYQSPLIKLAKAGEPLLIKAIVVSPKGRQSLAASGRYGLPRQPAFAMPRVVNRLPTRDLRANKNGKANALP